MSKFFTIPQIANFTICKYAIKKAECWNEPVKISLIVTDRCTLSCKWCFRQTDEALTSTARPDMTLDIARRIVKYFPKATHLGLVGFGEPLLVDDLFEIAVEFRKRPMRVNMITNGTLIVDRIDEIIGAGLHRISVSVNSLDSHDHRSISSGSESTFNNVLKGIRLLSERRNSSTPYLHLSFVLTRNLFDRTQEIIKFAEKAGVDFLDLHNLILHNNSNNYAEMLTSDDDEVVSKLSEWSRKEYKVRVGWPRLVQKKLEKPIRICKSSWDWLGVDMEGNTAGCSKAMPANEKFGNLFQEGKGVWNNEFRQNLRINFLKERKILLRCCKTCTEIQP